MLVVQAHKIAHIYKLFFDRWIEKTWEPHDCLQKISKKEREIQEKLPQEDNRSCMLTQVDLL